MESVFSSKDDGVICQHCLEAYETICNNDCCKDGHLGRELWWNASFIAVYRLQHG